MPDLNLDDITLHYEDEGTAINTPPLVLISGMLSDSASWGPFGQSLTKSHRVIRPDNRTTGRTTPALAATSPEQNAADLLALLDHLQIAQAHLIGHSMGGYIAAELSALAPDRTASLTLLSSAPLNLARSWHLFQTLTDIRRTAPEGLWLRALFPWLFHHDFFEDPAKIEGAVAASLAYPFAQSLLVKIPVIAKQNAASAAVSTPILIGAAPGRVTSNIPIKPSTAAITRGRVSFSPKNKGESSKIQSGEVNSSANTCAKGMTVIAKNHRFCPVKCATLRSTCTGAFCNPTSRSVPK